jgi:hypothetical protein
VSRDVGQVTMRHFSGPILSVRRRREMSHAESETHRWMQHKRGRQVRVFKPCVSTHSYSHNTSVLWDDNKLRCYT